MKESEYILMGNLTKAEAAIRLIGDMHLGNDGHGQLQSEILVRLDAIRDTLRERTDEVGDSPAELDLAESVGELRLALDALARKVAKLEARPSVGIGGEWVTDNSTTATPLPFGGWIEGPFSDEEWAEMVSDACQNPTPRRKS